MITQVHGTIRSVQEETLVLSVPPWELEILIPEMGRRQLQGRLGEAVDLHTVFYIEGNQMSGRMTPRLVGFSTPVEREFFDVFCSVDGVGVRKALRAMALPVRDIARTIQDQDVKTLATYPGIGEAMAERIVAKLRRKVGKFALMVAGLDTRGKGQDVQDADPDVIRDTYAALISVGHGDAHARQLIDRVLTGKRKYKTTVEMLEAIYRNERDAEAAGGAS